MANKRYPIGSLSDVERMLSETKLYQFNVEDMSGTINPGQQLINELSYNNISGVIYDAVRSAESRYDVDISLEYDENAGSIVGIATPKNVKVEANVIGLVRRGQKSKEAVKIEIPVVDARNGKLNRVNNGNATNFMTAGNGKKINRNIAVFDRNGNDQLFRYDRAFWENFKNSIQRSNFGSGGLEGFSKNWHSVTRAMNAIYNKFSKDALEEQREMDRVVGGKDGKDPLHFIENMVKSSEIAMGDYLQRIALSYRIYGKHQNDLAEIAQRILKSDDPYKTAEAALHSNQFRGMWGKKSAPSSQRMKQLLTRLADISNRYGLNQTSLKDFNENTVLRGSLGAFDFTDDLFVDISNEIKRNQTMAQTMRVALGRKDNPYKRSAIRATSKQKDIGLKRGGAITTGELLPFDAQVFGVISGSGQFNSQDQILISDKLSKNTSIIRDKKVKVLMAAEGMQEEEKVRLEKEEEAVKQQYERMKKKGDLEKRARDYFIEGFNVEEEQDWINAIRFQREMKSIHPSSSSKFRYSGSEKDGNVTILRGKETTAGGVGTVMLGMGAKGPAIIRTDGNGKNLLDAYGADFAFDVPDIGNVRKGGEIFNLLINTLFQEYGENGLKKGESLVGALNTYIKAREGSAESEAANAILQSIEKEEKNKREEIVGYSANIGKIRKVIREKKNYGSVMQAIPLVIDELIYGEDRHFERIGDVVDWIRDPEGNTKPMRVATELHPREGQHDYGEADMSIPLASMVVELQRAYDNGNGGMTQSEFERRKQEIEATTHAMTHPDKRPVDIKERAADQYHRITREMSRTAARGYDFSHTYDPENKENARYMIMIGNQKDMDARGDFWGAKINAGEIQELNEDRTNFEQTLRGKIIAARNTAFDLGVRPENIDIGLDLGDQGYEILEDSNGNKVSGRGVVLVNDAIFEDGANVGTAQEKDLSYIIRTLVDAEGGTMAAAELIPGYIESQVEDIFSKGGVLYDDAEHQKVKGSKGYTALAIQGQKDWLKADKGTGIGYIQSETAKHGALVSEGEYEELLNGIDNKDLLKTINRINKEIGGIDEITKFLDRKRGKGKQQKKYDKDLRDLYTKIFTIEGSEKETALSAEVLSKMNPEQAEKFYKTGVQMLLTRSPNSRLLNTKVINPFVSASLKGGISKMAIASALMKTLGGDFDSDVVTAVATPDGMRDSANALQKYQIPIIDTMSVIEQEKLKEDAKKTGGLTEKNASLIVDKPFGEESALKQRLQKVYTGHTGNIRLSYENFFNNGNTSGHTIPEAEILGAFFEGISQDAISSKKIVNQIIKSQGVDPETVSDDEAVAAWEKGYGEIVEVISGIKGDGSIKHMFDTLKDLGLITDENVFKPEKWEIIADPLRRIVGMKNGLDFLKNNGYTAEQIDLLGREASGEVLTEDERKILADIYTSGISTSLIEDSAYNLGQQINVSNSAADTIHHFANSKISGKEIKNPADASRFDEFYEADKNLDENTTELGKLTQAITALIGVLGTQTGGGGSAPREIKSSITGAVNRSIPFRGGARKYGENDTPDANSAQFGSLGHDLVELLHNFGVGDFDDVKVPADALKGVLDKYPEAKPEDIEKAKEQAKIMYGLSQKNNPEETNRRSAGASEIEIGKASGLHGILDTYVIDTVSGENGENRKVLKNIDFKFSNHSDTDAYRAEVILQNFLLKREKERILGLAREVGDFADYGEKNYRDKNGNITRGLDELTRKQVYNQYADLMMEQYGKGVEGKEREKKREAYYKLGQDLFESDYIGNAELHGVNSEGKTLKTVVNTDIPQDILAKFLAGGSISPEELIYLRQGAQYGDLAKKQPQQRGGLSYVQNDVARGVSYTLGTMFRGGFSAKVLQGAIKDLKKIYQLTLQLDQSITNLRIITGKNEEQAKDMMKTYNGLAKELGATTQAVAQAGSEWMRQGYDMNESLELVKSSTYLAKLGFMDQNQAVQALTASMKGFNLSASDSMDIVDKLTTLDAKYATTAGDIATALSNTASVAKSANMDLDETAAAITTIIDTTQMDASSAGNAMKTILSRYGNVKAGAFTTLMGDTEEDAESINDVEKVLGALGIKIRSSTMEMRDMSDVLDELAEKWTTLSTVERNLIKVSA